MKRFLMVLFAAMVCAPCLACALPQGKTEEISVLYGPVTGADSRDKVVLTARKSAGSPLEQDVAVRVYDAVSGRLKASIQPKIDVGYGSEILLADFLGGGVQQIYLGIASGGSGAFAYCYVYDLSGGEVQTVYDFEQFSASNPYSAFYQDGYRILVTELTTGRQYLIDLSLRSKAYLAELYDENGKLRRPQSADVSGANTALPFFSFEENRYHLLVYQRITGLYSADSFGYMLTQLRWEENSFENYFNLCAVS